MVKGNVTPGMRRKWDKRIAFCLEHMDKCTDWEKIFIASIKELRDEGKDLNWQRVYKLYEIYKKIETKTG